MAQVTCAENLAKFGRVVFETRERTDRQTYIHADTGFFELWQPKAGLTDIHTSIHT